MMKTLTVIGGGSAYVPGLVSALLHHVEELSLTQVRLFDLHAQNVELVAKLSDKMARAKNASLQVSAHTDLLEALRDVDVVLNTARPGGFECRRIDETLPLEFGIPGQETVGPGGFFFALRSVPAALDLARELERLAPHAVILNYTNPTNIVTQAISEHVSLPVIGLCDQSEEDLHDLCRALDSPAIFEFSPVGLNHAVWYRDVHILGTPLQYERVADLEPPPDLVGTYRLRFELSRELAKQHPGSWPSSYLSYYYWPERFIEIAKAEGPRADQILERLPFYFEHFREEAMKDRPDLRHHRGAGGFGDLAVRVLRALNSSIGISTVLNVPNLGAAPDFQPSTVVEASAYVSNAGIIRSPAPEVPLVHRPLLLRLEHHQRAAAAAAAAQDYRLAVEALAENPLVSSMTLAEQMLERAKTLYGSAIPMFA